MARDTGTKDKYSAVFVDTLQTQLNKWGEEKKSTSDVLGDSAPDSLHGSASGCHEGPSRTLVEILTEIRTSMPDSIYNPVLDIPGMK